MLTGKVQEWIHLTQSFGLSKGSGLFFRFAAQRIGTGLKLATIQVPGLRTSLCYRPGGSDKQVFRKVFIENEYASPSAVHDDALSRYYERLLGQGRRPVIVDCGANIGLASIWYATKYPNALILAIEPETENFEVLRRNVEGYGNVTAVHAAVSDRPGRVSLANVGDKSWAWETKEAADGPIKTVTVPALLEDIPEAALLIAKVDIEGFEVELFRSNVDWARHAALIVFEPHDWLFPWRGTAHAVFSALREPLRDYLHKGENVFAYSHSLKT